MLKRIFLICFCLLSLHQTQAQDTLWLPFQNYVTGEIKEMKEGVLKIETEYSENDLEIEWLKIDSVSTTTRFLITISGNERHTGKLRSTGKSGRAEIRKLIGSNIPTNLVQIVALESLEDDFWGRVDAQVDFGLNLTKANNLQQFNANALLGYKADRWNISGTYAALSSRQDSIADIERRDYGITFTYYPKKKWYTYSNLTWFSNTEQAVDLRFSARLGIGRALIQNNKAKWGLVIGVAPLNERFSNDEPETQSTEAFIGTDWNLFDTGDLSFNGSLFAYPSLTEKNAEGQRRFRTDLTFNIKYDLPLDFYIKTSLTLNYDSQPAVVGNETDYVWTLGFGWEL